MDRFRVFRDNATTLLLTHPHMWLDTNLEHLNKECIDWSTMLLVMQRSNFELEIDISDRKEEYEMAGIYGLNYGYNMNKSEISLRKSHYGTYSDNSKIICFVDYDVINIFSEETTS